MLGAPTNAAPELSSMIPPRPRSTIDRPKWWVSCIGAKQFRCSIPSAELSSLSRKGTISVSDPAQYTSRPISRSAVAAAIFSAALPSDRSTTNVRVWAFDRDSTASATSSRACCRRASKTTLSPRAASSAAKAAPTPSEAPATRAQGPYLSANVMITFPRTPPRCRDCSAGRAVPDTQVCEQLCSGSLAPVEAPSLGKSNIRQVVSNSCKPWSRW